MKSWQELQEFLKADEKNEEGFKEIAKNKGFITQQESDDYNKGLVAKRDELLALQVKTKSELEEYKRKYSEIDFDEINKLKEGVKGKEKVNEVAEQLQKQIKALETKLKQKEESESALKKENDDIFMQIQIDKAIGEKYNPLFREDVKEIYSRKAKIVEAEGKKEVYIDDDTIGYLPVKEFFPKLLTIDKGKKYAYEPKNSGTQSNKFNAGTSGKAGMKTLTMPEFDKLPLAEQIAYSKEVRAGNAILSE